VPGDALRLKGACDDCDKGIQANNYKCKYASFYYVFHKTKFNTIKKGKHEAKGNSFTHQLTKLEDEMR
jgi:hypothetical protein